MVLELESLAADRALELPLLRPVHVVGHVPLQLGQVGKLLRARLTGLQCRKWDKFSIGLVQHNNMTIFPHKT